MPRLECGHFFSSHHHPGEEKEPSRMLVAGKDRTVNPTLKRRRAAQAKGHTIELPVTRRAVAALIEEAASKAREKRLQSDVWLTIGSDKLEVVFCFQFQRSN